MRMLGKKCFISALKKWVKIQTGHWGAMQKARISKPRDSQLVPKAGKSAMDTS